MSLFFFIDESLQQSEDFIFLDSVFLLDLSDDFEQIVVLLVDAVLESVILANHETELAADFLDDQSFGLVGFGGPADGTWLEKPTSGWLGGELGLLRG